MQMQDKTKFTNLMVGMKELYGEVILESQIEFYWEVFRNVELKELRQAFKCHIHNRGDGDSFPSLRTLLQFIDHNIKAGQAWLIAQSAFHKVAHYERFILTDPIIQHVLEEMGGLVKPRAAVLKEIHFYATEFKDRYRKFLDTFQNKTENSE